MIHKTLHKKINDRATRTPLKTGGLAVPVPLVTPEHHLIWKSCVSPVYVNKCY